MSKSDKKREIEERGKRGEKERRIDNQHTLDYIWSGNGICRTISNTCLKQYMHEGGASVELWKNSLKSAPLEIRSALHYTVLQIHPHYIDSLASTDTIPCHRINKQINKQNLHKYLVSQHNFLSSIL